MCPYPDGVASRFPTGHRRPAGGPLPDASLPVSGRQRDRDDFERVLEALRAAVLRPEVVVEEVPAPTRLAPHAVALSAEVLLNRHTDEDALATGRFVLLHDPSAPEPWEGVWRVVTYAKAVVEPEVGQDPMAGQVGWAWLSDSLSDRGLGFTAEAGAVTCVISESFGALSERPTTVELEIRASWSPLDDYLEEHLVAWSELLCTIAGLPPLPEGVTALPGRR